MRTVRTIQRLLHLYSPGGRSGRVITALFLAITGLGRLGVLTMTAPHVDSLQVVMYGWLEIVGAVAMLLTLPYRTWMRGRLTAATCAVIMAGIIWDVAAINVSVMVLALATFALTCETFTDHAE